MTQQKLSFSQRYGYTKVNNVLQVESLNNGLRNDIWNFLYMQFFEHIILPAKPPALLIRIYADFLQKRVDNIPLACYDRQEALERILFYSVWYNIYNFLEFLYNDLCQHSTLANATSFAENINNILLKNNAGYRMIRGEITPITDENEIRAIQQAVNGSPYEEIGVHLTSALRFFSDKTAPDYRNSIKESISAVEVYCRKITKTNTLGDALKKLHNAGVNIPSILKEAITKLYAFTNGEEGIRHALMDDPKVGQSEAYFMLIACSSFINYLKSKQSVSK